MAPKRKATTTPSTSTAPKRARKTTARKSTTRKTTPRKATTPKRRGWPRDTAERELYGFREPVTYASDEDVDLDTPELVHSRPYDGKKTYKTRLAEGLPPIHDLEEMYRLMTSKALELGLDEALKHMGSRPLRVATVCSGTESPLLALEMVRCHLETHFDRTLPFRHLFSAEIVPFKQAYIERNFHPRYLFRDVNQLKDRVAATAYGSIEKVPKNVDLLVAGFSCVDFSGLNNNRKTLDQQGESGGTFWAIVRHARVYRPRIMVLENVKLAPWTSIVQYLAEIDYLGIHVGVDTKAFYLPQTRERGYMICIDKKLMQARGLKKEDFEGWPEIVRKFRRPASSPIGMFAFGHGDKRLEQIERDMVARLAATTTRTHVGWEKYQLRHHYYRTDNDLGHKRPATRFQDNGARQVLDFAWRRFSGALPERVLDTIDCNFLRKLRDGYDMSYKERCLELSQGVDRETDSRAYGIMGCITPSGIPYLTTRGGPLCGAEALALQGLPVGKLILTRESQRDLQDLAGNAMSSTVVCAATLSALIVAHPVLEKGEMPASTTPKCDLSSCSASQAESVTFKGNLQLNPNNAQTHCLELFDTRAVLEAAARSARYCICEKQSAVKDTIFECQLCEHTACDDCHGNPTHFYNRPKTIKRSIPSDFVRDLRKIIPNRLMMVGITAESWGILKSDPSVKCPSAIWEDFLKAVMRTVGDELRFSDISRGKLWTVSYEGKHSVLHLVINPASGLEWRLFAKPLESDPGLSVNREILSKPIARMAVSSDSLLAGTWQVCAPLSSRLTLVFEPAGEKVPSYEAKCGLQGEEIIASQVWTKVIVQGTDEDMSNLEVDVRGTYELLPECGTASASLHKRKATEDNKPAVYLFLDPTKLGEPKYDSFVFALEHGRDPSYARRLTIAEVAHTWRPSRQSEAHEESVHAYYRRWTNTEAISLQPYSSDASITLHNLEPGHVVSIDHTGCESEHITLLSLSAPVNTIGSTWNVGSWEVSNPLDSQAELRDLAWLLLRATTTTGYEDWNQIVEKQAMNSNGEFSGCTTCTPPKPAMIWSCNARGHIKACEDPRDAALYERQLKAKPVPFLVFRRVDENNFGNLRITLNVQTLLHQAYDKLAGSSTIGGASFLWRLVPNAHDSRNLAFSEFQLRNNNADIPCGQPPNFKLKLRPEQLRSLHWMVMQESDDIEPFAEEEVEEALLPQLMWRAEAKVTALKTIRGGVLADDVGYGKTALILGLIDAQSRQGSAPRSTPGFIPTNATLILTPRNLFKQWRLEITKFLGTRYKVLAFSNRAELAKKTIREIRKADIVLVTWEVFGDQNYHRTMQMFTGMPRVPAPQGRNFLDWFSEAHQSLKEQVETLMNKGPSAFLESLQGRRRKFRNTTANFTYNPSKRLRGRHYAEANAGEPRNAGIDVEYAALSSADEESDANDERDPHTLRSKISRLVQLQPLRTFAPPKKKKKNEEEEQALEEGAAIHGTTNDETNEAEAVQAESDRDDTEYEDLDAPPRPKKAATPSRRKADKKGKKSASGQPTLKKPKASLFWSDREEFNIDRKTEKTDWDTMKNSLIHQYSWERVVIDEFTYVKVEPKPIAAIQARARWVLSGTPPLNNFADVNTIAPFLGVHLGIDDDDMKSHNVLGKLKKKIQSDAEVFQAYRAPRSESWHRNRHEHAQTFLDRFARKNVPCIGEIPCTEHTIEVSLLPVETTIYEELRRQLDGLSAQAFCGSRSKHGSKREKRLDDLIRGSSTAMEALLKRCTTFALSHQWKNGKPEDTTCKSLIETRQKHIEAAVEVFALEVKLAVWLLERADKNVPNFQKFVDSVGKNDFGDELVKIEARAIIEKAFLEKTDDDWKLFFAEPVQKKDKADREKEDEDTGESEEGETKKAKKDEPPKLPKKPGKKDEFDTVLRRTVTNMRSYIVEWVMRKRALRYLEAVHRVQADLEIICDKCQDRILTASEVNILSSCGHVICSICTSSFVNEECVVTGCHGELTINNLQKGSMFGCSGEDRSARYGGSKLDKMVEILQAMPRDDKALIFIQYEEIRKVASMALDLAKIKHTAIIDEDTSSIKKLEGYLTKGWGESRVLILMLGNEMSAGLNLQAANHVMFLSPLLAETQYNYESTMTQAVGRARRYGQTKHVHVYHMLARRTVDETVCPYRQNPPYTSG
ncbi:hypothetical protein P170DRAFT_464536 [Aspergillus steynii IBT 23096]|uniref:Helicase ATP-binding domain-containing protein n=1 Tax=Aspergillus steynii IBT 23096 TaxID=1392250 RepID=A0A2I2G7V9_9EURO|nr:uncharacterized protein P170DRAFT_464536 [Aspergillus steynii IBT 23096]PLB48961.1 hypothetical protein P170DRAFT_464536 [Aspergillus steynii IBT 23096]